jgi:hypothetical protein
MSDLGIGAIVVQEGGPHLRDFVVGYLRAYARLEHALTEATPVEHSVKFRSRSWEALFEALHWADAIDQVMAHGDPGRGADPNWLAKRMSRPMASRGRYNTLATSYIINGGQPLR